MARTFFRRVRPVVLALTALFVVGMMACGGDGGNGGSSGAKSTGTPKRMIIETTAGRIVCELYPDKAPMTVDIISGLADGSREWTHPGTGQQMTNTPFYDDIIFHRVIPNFMIQMGDPLGKGYGGPGFTFDDEFSPDLSFDQPGRLGMANPGQPNSNGSQFFITVVPTPHLTGRHTIFGQVVEGMDVAVAISEVPRDGGDKPRQDVTIKSIRIERE